MNDTETLDKLYLEWSQFTQARNRREIEMMELLELAEIGFRTKHNVPKEWHDRYAFIKVQMK
jgi:hypothetical protein